ncbi:multicopper oxidase family protein [Edaphobacter albus]|uniref:multicopper oxidase family protein n=1 Tax=Edaphobacter sp. 4G125 TaxID=2763071 RepID=UPI002102393F|nr:multicopper oxidase family protein [Edaphobacter sp. 4G125]
MIDRRHFLKLSGMATAELLSRQATALASPDYSLTIGSASIEIAPRRFIKTTAYNRQAPGPLLRMKEGVPVTIDVSNQSSDDEIVHWHGLFLPPEIDGAMEEGTPHIPAGKSARYTFTPEPGGFRWYHTHTSAKNNLKKALYSGQYGFLWIEPRENPGRYDQEFFLALHDWDGSLVGSDDGSMNPVYNYSTINGKTLGFGEPLRVRQGQRVVLHIVNTSATEPHWLALAGHQFKVMALDGNPVPSPRTVSMLHLSPAERVSVEVEMNNPGVWVLGEVRKHVQAIGMGIVVEYADRSGKPAWQQPQMLRWDYLVFGATAPDESSREIKAEVIPLTFTSKFIGHGAMDRWMINGRSFPDTETISLRLGQRYRLAFKNKSMDDHPVHLHRHTFELRSMAGRATRGIMKDTVLVKAGTEAEVEFTANMPGLSLFHCHQQDHMDMGFMMLFRGL